MDNDFESPQDKAKRLGVPLIEPVAWPEPLQAPKAKQDQISDYYKEINKTISVCGGCGKEVTIATRKEPCGKNNCPFGRIDKRLCAQQTPVPK